MVKILPDAFFKKNQLQNQNVISKQIITFFFGIIYVDI